MPISRLPDVTVRELGSTLAVRTPVELIKELVDNAIDADASFVDLIVSQNTLDRIEVRDNGHGIPLDDLDSLGRSGYTSKITTFDDLITLSGKSLGFRGVALASINTVAEVSLTTRTAKEPVAIAFQLSHGGGIASRKQTAAPVGTIVLATKLFSRTPVREKLALKKSRENLVKIKELLKSYALARPQIKLQFRVVTGKNTISWSYAPNSQANIKDAITQVFGTGLASSCAPHTFHGTQCDGAGRRLESADELSLHTPGEGADLTFEAYLPHTSADIYSIISLGAFFSIDSRPVASTRGTFKKIYSSFKTHFSRFIRDSSSDQNVTLPNPFIRLDIQCAPGSYDANIEPSKDDVLFRDEGYVINQFENFMSSVYPITVDKPNEPTTFPLSTQAASSGEVYQNGLTIAPGPDLSAQKANYHSQPTALGANSRNEHCRRSFASEKTIEVGGTTLDSSSPPGVPLAPTVTLLRLPSIEKTAKTRENTTHGSNSTPPNTSSELEYIRKPPSEKLPEAARTSIKSSRPSGQNFGYMRDPASRSEETCYGTGGGYRADLDVEGGMADPRYPVNLDRTPMPSQIPHAPSPNLVGVQDHDDFQPHSFVVDVSAPIDSSDDDHVMPHGSRPHTKPRRVGGRELGEDEEEEGGGAHLEGVNPWSIAKLTAPRRPPRQPLPHPVDNELETADIQAAPGARRQSPAARMSPRQYRAADTMGPSRKPPLKVPGGAYKKPTIAEVRDRARGEMVQTTLERFHHINQPIVDTREGSLTPNPQTTLSKDTSFPVRLPKDDPRGYLLKGQHTIANDMSNKLRRPKTELLPLEMTPLGFETHTLTLRMNVSTSSIASLSEKTSPLDWYCRGGKAEGGIHDIKPYEIDNLMAQADAMASSRYLTLAVG